MDKDRESKENKNVRCRKQYDACIRMILSEELVPDEIRDVFTLVCHKSVEQIIYNTIIYEHEDDDGDKIEKIAEKGSKLYYIHKKLNQKLNRSDHIRFDERDEFLLDCIVSEILRRRRELSGESGELLKERIYKRYCSMNLADFDRELSPKDSDEEHDDFDEYVEYLFKEEHNGIVEIYSNNYLWSLLGRKRDQTFRKRRPSKDELYMFCFALALNCKGYRRLKKLLLRKMEEEGLSGSRKYKQYLCTNERDEVLEYFLETIDTRLLIVRGEVKGNRELIPSTMIKKVNYDLDCKGFLPLKIGKKTRKSKGDGGM